ncbi:hypothetical protein RIMD111065_16140 [Aeromonas hydrophila]|nr:hypothetical protein RIMD111065_16140 [Aeromonas hydrophila]
MITAISIDQQGTDPCQSDGCTQSRVGKPTPAKSGDSSSLRPIIIDGVVKQIARYCRILRHHDVLILISKIIDWRDSEFQGGLNRIGAIGNRVHDRGNSTVVVGCRGKCEAAIAIDDKRTDPVDCHTGSDRHIGVASPAEEQNRRS